MFSGAMVSRSSETLIPPLLVFLMKNFLLLRRLDLEPTSSGQICGSATRQGVGPFQCFWWEIWICRIGIGNCWYPMFGRPAQNHHVEEWRKKKLDSKKSLFYALMGLFTTCGVLSSSS